MTKEKAIEVLRDIAIEIDDFCNGAKHWCDKDKEELEALDMAIKALNAEDRNCETCANVYCYQNPLSIISQLTDLLDEYDELDEHGLHDPKWCGVKEAYLIVKNSLHKVSRPQGEWIDSDGSIYCSNCGAEAPIDEWEYKYRDKIRQECTNFCPDCGAKMNGANDECV